MSVAAGSCDQCKATGLPILPVRYTVVPDGLKPHLPSWAGGNRVKSVDIGPEFRYALRTVRTGFIYLFYEKHARGNRYWECYSVCQDGSLTLQPSPMAAKPYVGNRLLCARQTHVANAVHYLVIERPEQCGATWIAFSQDKWSDETLKEYTDNTRLRNARMQTIHPAQMIDGAKHAHGAFASKDTLADVLEYAATVSTHVLPDASVTGIAGGMGGTGGTGDISTSEDGSYNEPRLKQMSTRYPWALRQGAAEATAAHMKGRAKAAGGKPGTPHVLALWDAIGIAHELNGFRNDAAGWIKKYGDERELQISALNTYDGLQKALGEKAANDQERSQDEVAKSAAAGYSPQELTERRVQAQGLPEPQRSQTLETIDIQDAWGQRGVPTTLGFGGRLHAANALPEPRRTQEINKVRADVDQFMQRRTGNAQNNLDAARAEAWPKYKARLDGTEVTFRQKLDTFQYAAGTLIETRTQPLVRWLEAPLFIDALTDYHGQNIEDGMLFEGVVAEAIFGIGSCKAGHTKIQAWVEEAKAGMQTNLLWRAVALNQDEARISLDVALADAQQHKSQQTTAMTVAWTGYTAKFLKALADTYKKAQGVFDSNTKAASPAGSVVFGARIIPVNMRGADKLAITVGDAVFRHFRIDKLADHASEKIIQHIFSIRAFVNPADSVNLIIQQAEKEELLRHETLKRLRTARSFVGANTPAIKNAQAEALGAAWQKFKADTSTPDKATAVASASKDARLALVVGLIEGVNFAKLIADCKAKNDVKSWLSLAASGMSITSALFDIGTVAAKNMPGMGAASWSYQALKLWGGLLSGGAAFVGGGLDLRDATTNHEKGYEPLMYLLVAKALGSAVSGFATFGVTYTYSAPLISRLAGRGLAGTAVKVVGERAAALIALRIMGMALSGWITVGLFGLQIIIWWVTPNALKEWVDHSAFGKKRGTGGFKTAEEQDKQLRNALVEMGLQ